MSESMSMEYQVDESPEASKWITLTARRVLGFWWSGRRPYRDEDKMLAVWETIAEEERAFWRACTCDRGLFTVSLPPRADCTAHFPAASIERTEAAPPRIESLLERSSLGTREAQALRASVSDERAAEILRMAGITPTNNEGIA